MKINKERIKYSPFGKRIMNGFKAELLISLCTAPLGLLCCSFALMAGSITAFIIMALLLLGIPAVLVAATIKSTLFEARRLSAMTDEEHNRLILEYKKYEERNIIRYGHLTSYGWVMGDRIFPWGNIKKIEIKPGEYIYVHGTRGGHYKYFPPEIVITALFDKKAVTATHTISNEDYDLSDEIERFLNSIPKYTEYRFAVDNGYYFAK